MEKKLFREENEKFRFGVKDTRKRDDVVLDLVFVVSLKLFIIFFPKKTSGVWVGDFTYRNDELRLGNFPILRFNKGIWMTNPDIIPALTVHCRYYKYVKCKHVVPKREMVVGDF